MDPYSGPDIDPKNVVVALFFFHSLIASLLAKGKSSTLLCSKS